MSTQPPPLRIAVVGGGAYLATAAPALPRSRHAGFIGIAGLAAAQGFLQLQKEGANIKLDVYEGAVGHPLLWRGKGKR